MSNTYSSVRWPEEIRYISAERRLRISFDDGTQFSYPAEYLRVESPSAEVQGHGPGQKQLVPGRRYVGIMEIEAVGNYAIRIKFDDFHETGIYSWTYLYQLGQEHDTRWPAYESDLTEAGLSRDPPGRPGPA